MAVLGLRFCARAFSSCGRQGPLFIAVRGPLTVAASLIAGHRLQTRRLSNCGSRAQLLHGMWDLPRPGLEPVSPALAGRFSTTAPPGKPQLYFLTWHFLPKIQTQESEAQWEAGVSPLKAQDLPSRFPFPIWGKGPLPQKKIEKRTIHPLCGSETMEMRSQLRVEMANIPLSLPCPWQTCLVSHRALIC